METENNVKPKDVNLNEEKPFTPAFELDVSMLSEEAYKLEKQQKQEVLIQKARETVPKPIESQIPQEVGFLQIGQLEDYLLFLNEWLENRKIPPLTNEEINQIIGIIDEFKGFSFSGILEGDPQPRSFIKDATKAWKIWKVIKKILYPRIEPYLKPLFQDKLIPYFKNYFKLKLSDFRNEQI